MIRRSLSTLRVWKVNAGEAARWPEGAVFCRSNARACRFEKSHLAAITLP